MQPRIETAAALLPILDELKRREPLFHHPGGANTRAEYDAMMDASFWETGASGRRYSREYVLDVLERRAREPVVQHFEAEDFHCAAIAADHYLLTYTLRQDHRLTRRMSIWRRTEAGWKILYHQGTVVEA